MDSMNNNILTKFYGFWFCLKNILCGACEKCAKECSAIAASSL